MVYSVLIKIEERRKKQFIFYIIGKEVHTSPFYLVCFIIIY